MKHTPGPYTLETREHVHAILCKPTRKGEHAEVLLLPVEACPFPGQPKGDLSAGSVMAQQRTPAELLANARLFAAAPTLLAALKRLRNSPDCNLDELEPETIKALDDALEAICDAEGR